MMDCVGGGEAVGQGDDVRDKSSGWVWGYRYFRLNLAGV